jgi:glutaredoxin
MLIIHRASRPILTLFALLLAGTAVAQTTFRWVDKDGHVHYSDQPPPPAQVKNLEMKQLKGPNVIDTGGAFSYETSQATKNAPLTLYTSEDCADNCKKARDLLAQRGAPYTEKLIRTLGDANEFRASTGYKELVVPVLKAGTQSSEQGYEETAWNRFLDNTGYPKRGNTTKPATAKNAQGVEGSAPGESPPSSRFNLSR